ncbi:hypothetical protein P4197_21760 [Pseudomonas aeruginosa]|nr:hypothetical protein [Pseudomonas aeruginosa]MDF5860388.1 hypothetical protein [Pseudomonas aeruginosa]
MNVQFGVLQRGSKRFHRRVMGVCEPEFTQLIAQPLVLFAVPAKTLSFIASALAIGNTFVPRRKGFFGDDRVIQAIIATQLPPAQRHVPHLPPTRTGS